MGAETFQEIGRGKTAREAFNACVSDAAYESGHGGYTGTIAEKHSFTMIDTVKTQDEAFKLAEKLIEDQDSRVDDKWGPAGCIEFTDAKQQKAYLFFGWASS